MLRYRAAEFVDRASIPTAFLALRKVAGVSPWITALTYHRVAPASAGVDYDEGTVDVTPEAFDRHVAYATRWFDLIGIDDLLGFVRGTSRLPPNPLLITFDDGYLDNLRVAVPILKKYGARATFFIATTYISERRLFWWDRLSYMVKRSDRETIDITYPVTASIPLLGAGDRARAFRTLRAFLTDHFGIDIWRFLDGVAEATRVGLTRDEEQRLADEMILTWDHVREMRAAGMDIQSHTCDHNVLTTLNEERLRSELGHSREVLEGVLREPVRAISYPVGRGVHTTPALRREVKAAGYELGFSANGVNHRWRFDPLDVKRMSLDFDASDAFFRTSLALPYVGH
jgi:peptidoglycan/xylan/chitin deacetylase (PgdA/CDA1 family)